MFEPGKKTVPTGPHCPNKCRTKSRQRARLWRNKTKSGKSYFRCSVCGDCWWVVPIPLDAPYHPDLEEAVGKKWPHLPIPEKEINHE